jgi:hypothetical protein
MQRAVSMRIMDAWYFQVDASSVVQLFTQHAQTNAKQAAKTVKKAHGQTGGHTFEKLTRTVGERRQFINDPPLVARLSDLLTDEQKVAVREQGDVEKAWQGYLNSLPEERRVLLKRFRITDAALRVGGVGSVGTRCLIALLEGDKPEDALILQQKEANPSALEAYLDGRAITNQAERIVIGQHVMQASSDYFLGWSTREGAGHYYWRQLKDMKGSFDVTAFDVEGFATYLAVCAGCLARAHARSGDAVAISSYMGQGSAFDDAIGRFAVTYADQTERDYQALLNAVNSGRIVAETGV